jgi:NAD(P)H-dependent FMN reductase
MKLLALSGSLRRGSLNRRLVEAAAAAARTAGTEVEVFGLGDFPMPVYDQDLQDRDGFPGGAARLKERLDAAHGFVIASPEYNFSLPGGLKNAIDWLSRYRPQPFGGKSGLLLSASPSLVGGNRGLWALRVPLEALGAPIFPEMFSLAEAQKQFADDGRLSEPRLQERLEALVARFVRWAERATSS